MSRESYWVTPSLLWNKWPISLPALTTRLAQWQYQLNSNRATLGHSWCTIHSMSVRLSSLNALRVSIRRKPQSSSWTCYCPRIHTTWIPPSVWSSNPPQNFSVTFKIIIKSLPYFHDNRLFRHLTYVIASSSFLLMPLICSGFFIFNRSDNKWYENLYFVFWKTNHRGLVSTGYSEYSPAGVFFSKV